MFRYCYLHGWWEAVVWWYTQPHRLGQKRPGRLGSLGPKISLTWKCRPESLHMAMNKALPTHL